MPDGEVVAATERAVPLNVRFSAEPSSVTVTVCLLTVQLTVEVPS